LVLNLSKLNSFTTKSAMRRLQAMPIDKPRMFIIMYARCLLKDLKLCLIRLLNIIKFNKGL
jgi:hypothetical protein